VNSSLICTTLEKVIKEMAPANKESRCCNNILKFFRRKDDDVS
jgi:hypothetical protein